VRRPRHKFNASRTERNGRAYASKAEAAYADNLAIAQHTGDVLFWLEQVPIPLPGRTKYVVDFQVFHADGSVRFVDVKGCRTETFELKARQVSALYPFDIEVVSASRGRKRRKT
jgi:hypothetical protein